MGPLMAPWQQVQDGPCFDISLPTSEGGCVHECVAGLVHSAIKRAVDGKVVLLESSVRALPLCNSVLPASDMCPRKQQLARNILPNFSFTDLFDALKPPPPSSW